MLVGRFFADVFLDVAASRSHRIACIQHMQNHVRAINHFVQLSPDTP